MAGFNSTMLKKNTDMEFGYSGKKTYLCKSKVRNFFIGEKSRKTTDTRLFNTETPYKKMKHISYNVIILSIITILTNLSANAQDAPTQKKQPRSFKVEKLDLIYVDEESENVSIDQSDFRVPALAPSRQKNESNSTAVASQRPDSVKYKRSEHPLKRRFLEESDNENESDEEGDSGAESEDDILYASFDTNAIHYTKTDFLSNSDTVILIPLMNSSKERFVNPAVSYRISSHFGPRRRRWHYGVDLAMPTGKEIYSTFDGTVRVAKRNRSYGNLVVIRHNNGLETYYAHLSKINVHSGQNVKAGDCIGECGNTGRSYGSHLHYEMRYLGSAMNPEMVIDFTGQRLLNDTIHLSREFFRNKKTSANGGNAVAHKSNGGTKYHTVRSGDTLGRIASRNHTTVKKLCRLNGIKETSVLRLGQKIRVR